MKWRLAPLGLGFLLGVAACEPRATESPAQPHEPPSPSANATKSSAAKPSESPEAIRRAARADAAAISDPEQKLAAHERLLKEALAADPREAVAWLRGLADRELAAMLLDQALADWAGVDAPGAGAYLAAMPPSDYRTTLAGELATAWAAQDGAAAVAWASSLNDQEAREEALRGALDRVAGESPAKAAELALGAAADGDRAAALERVLETWWQNEPAAAEAWAAQRPDKTQRDLARRLLAALRESTPSRPTDN